MIECNVFSKIQCIWWRTFVGMRFWTQEYLGRISFIKIFKNTYFETIICSKLSDKYIFGIVYEFTIQQRQTKRVVPLQVVEWEGWTLYRIWIQKGCPPLYIYWRIFAIFLRIIPSKVVKGGPFLLKYTVFYELYITIRWNLSLKKIYEIWMNLLTLIWQIISLYKIHNSK